MMKSNTLKANSIFKKVVAAVVAAAIAIGIAAGFGTQRVQAAEERVISDELATAHIYSDGSGYIETHDTFTARYPLNDIDGVALKDIITFNDGGYVDTIYTAVDGSAGDISDIYAAIYPYIVCVHGAGPKGFCSGSGYLHFTDESDDTYNLSLWSHAESWHTVRYGSNKHDIVKISWNS